MNKKLTVIVMTFNHKDYIERSIGSILSQKTTFPFDILVHDDCSDDGTYEKILKLCESNPGRIKLVRQPQRKFPGDGFNLMICNYVSPLIETEYVAYCDGDDYWCDDNKLQKQFEFMEDHKEYSMCFHSAYQLKENNDLSSDWFFGRNEDIDLSFIINGQPGVHIATSSIFLKSSVFCNFVDWRKKFPVEDIPLYIQACIEGKVRRLSDKMCVYRQFASGSWSSQNKNNTEKTIKHLNEMYEAFSNFDESTDKKYHELVERELDGLLFRIAVLRKDLKVIFNKRNKIYLKSLSSKDRISFKLQYRLPHLYNLFHRKKK